MCRRRLAKRKNERRGAAVLEMSVVLMVFLILTMGMLDLSIGVFRYNVIAQTARRAAREAIVHGELATALGSWGPAPVDVAASQARVPEDIGVMLVGCDLDQTRVLIEWPAGSNGLEDPVRVTVSTTYTPIMLFVFNGDPINLSATSEMLIAH